MFEIYRITLPDGRTYYGQHSINARHNGEAYHNGVYMGSGVLLANYYKKHGYEGVRKDIIFYVETQEEANGLERKIIAENRDLFCINLAEGGGTNVLANKGIKRNEEFKRRISKTLTGYKRTPEEIEKSAMKRRGRKRPNNTPEFIEKLAAAQRGMKWCNNGTKEKKAFELPEGFVWGKLPWTLERKVNYKVSDSAREKMRLSRLGRKPTPECIRKRLEKMKGFKWTEDQKRRFSEKRKGMPLTEKQLAALAIARTHIKPGACYKKVICVETGVVYESIVAAAISIGKTSSAIRNAIRKSSCSGGFHWKTA
jgi:hypothetical protein